MSEDSFSQFNESTEESIKIHQPNIINAYSLKILKQIQKNVKQNIAIPFTSQFMVFNDINNVRDNVEVFSEEIERMINQIPTIHQVKSLIKLIYHECNLTQEELIYAFILIDRFMEQSGIIMLPHSFRALLFTGMLQSHKYLTDNIIQFKDFQKIYPLYSLDQISKQEKRFLQCLQFKLYVSEQEYNQYFHQLVSLI